MRNCKVVLLVLLGIAQELIGANLDSAFAVDLEDIQLKEIAENVRRMSGAVLGLTEYVMEIRHELRTIRADFQSNITFKARPDSYFSRPLRDPEEVRRQSLELADKVERLLAMDQSPEVDLAKEELKRTVEKNFLRMLAAILVTGPAHTQERSDDIFKLMRSVLNGELDFSPVVQRLPLILRDSETNQFVNLLITLRESERGNSFRQELFNSVETSGAQVANNRQIFGNFPSTAQILNTLRNPSQLLSGNTQGTATTANNAVSSSQTVVTTNQNGQQVVSPANNVQAQQVQQVQQVQPQQQPQLQQMSQNQDLIDTTNSLSTGTGNRLPSINNILEAITQTNQLIREVPTLVEGLQTLVESIEGIIG